MAGIEYSVQPYPHMDFDIYLKTEANAMEQMETIDRYALCARGYSAVRGIEHDVEQVFGSTASLWTKESEMRTTENGIVLSFRYRVTDSLDCLFAGVCIIRLEKETESVIINDITTAKHLRCKGRDSTELWRALREA